MKDYLSEIDGRFPVRNSAEQKAAFREYALAEARTGAVPAREEENEGHTNLIFGDPAAAGPGGPRRGRAAVPGDSAAAIPACRRGPLPDLARNRP